MTGTYKIVLAGPAAVGKEDFIKLFLDHTFQGNVLRLWDIITIQLRLSDGNIVNVRIWTMENRERNKPLKPTLYMGANGVILIFDLARADTFDEITQIFYPEILKFTGPTHFLLIGNETRGCYTDHDMIRYWLDSTESEYMEFEGKVDSGKQQQFEAALLRVLGLSERAPFSTSRNIEVLLIS